VRWRAVGKRKVVVAPAAPRVGWELAVAGQGDAEELVVVKEVKPDVLVVSGPDGKLKDLEYVKEDTEENSRDLEGSVLPDDVVDAPYVESDISEWEEYDP
jgi:predicted metallo-beta-lactamase superfamily hydrolase